MSRIVSTRLSAQPSTKGSRVSIPRATFPLPPSGGFPAPASRLMTLRQQCVSWLEKFLNKRRENTTNLRLLETQQLGEKRFVAILQAGKQQFLIGGAAGSVVILSELNAQPGTARSLAELERRA